MIKMSNNTLNVKNIISKRFVILISLLVITSFHQVSCLRYNRGPLDEVPSITNNIDEDDEFTGSTYIEPTNVDDNKKEESLLQVEGSKSSPTNYDEDEEDEGDDEDEESEDESEDFLDRSTDSSLLEIGNNLKDRSNILSEDSGENTKKVDDSKLKNYLKKIGAIDRMKKVKAGGREAASSVKSKFRAIPGGMRKIKEKMFPPNPHYTTIKYEKENKGPHGRRLSNTTDDVDEKRRLRENRGKGPHGRRLFNTMNDVDERRRIRESERMIPEEQKAPRARKVLRIKKDPEDGIEEKEPPRYGNLKIKKKK